jgi:hypothetical protein
MLAPVGFSEVLKLFDKREHEKNSNCLEITLKMTLVRAVVEHV